MIIFPLSRYLLRRSKNDTFLCAAVTLLFVLSVCGQALAAGVIRPVRVFVYENTLYSYMELEDIHSPVTQAEVKIGNQSFPASGRLETVRQAGFPITYLLLVDNSTSMPPFREQLVEFGSQLASGSGENTGGRFSDSQRGCSCCGAGRPAGSHAL